jgi:hypothetical protein
MQDDASDVRDLVDDTGEKLPAHVGLGFEVGISAWTGGAEKVAPVGGFQIEAHRLASGGRSHGFAEAIVVAAWID